MVLLSFLTFYSPIIFKSGQNKYSSKIHLFIFHERKSPTGLEWHTGYLNYEFLFLGELQYFFKACMNYISLSLDFRRGFVENGENLCAEMILPNVLNQGFRRIEHFRVTVHKMTGHSVVFYMKGWIKRLGKWRFGRAESSLNMAKKTLD